MNDPVFIGGMMKSGTSLLRAILGQHPNIAAHLETFWFDMDKMPAQEVEAQLDRLAGFYDMPFLQVRNLYYGSPSSESFLDQFMAAFLSTTGKNRWLEKTPGNLIHVGRILAFWPDARVLVCLRDPRDVLTSFRLAGKSGDVDGFISLWIEQHKALSAALEALSADQQSVRFVDYQELVLDLEKTMRAVLTFLGEDVVPAVLSYEGNKADYEKVLEVTGTKSTTLARMRSPISNDRIGIFDSHLTKEECAAMTRAVGAAGLETLWNRALFSAGDQ